MVVNEAIFFLFEMKVFLILPLNTYLVRATVLLAGNIIEPHGENGAWTKLTQIAHVNPGGAADTPAIAWVRYHAFIIFNSH